MRQIRSPAWILLFVTRLSMKLREAKVLKEQFAIHSSKMFSSLPLREIFFVGHSSSLCIESFPHKTTTSSAHQAGSGNFHRLGNYRFLCVFVRIQYKKSLIKLEWLTFIAHEICINRLRIILNASRAEASTSSLADDNFLHFVDYSNLSRCGLTCDRRAVYPHSWGHGTDI